MSGAYESEEESPLDSALSPEELSDEGGQHLRWTVTKDAKFRLDKWLQQNISGASRNQIQKLIDLGGVTVNGKPSKASYKLREGEVVDAMLPPRPAVDMRGEDIPLDILYEDEDLIVINKQAGLIVHPARSRLSGTLLNALVHHFQQTGQMGRLSDVGKDDARPGVVHRLDMNTTGVIILAKRDETHWMLARQFEQRTNLKVYLAVCHGCPEPAGGALDQPIGKHPTYREAMAVRYDSQGRDSLTLYRVRERYQGYSLVEMELKSGRTHQIRVHMQYAGCPLVGDLVYGGEIVGDKELATPPRPAGARTHLVFARDKESGQRLYAEGEARAATGELVMYTPALHAALLRIEHPRTKEQMTFTAPVHSPLREMIGALRQRPAPGDVVTEGTHLDLSLAIPPA